MTFKDWQKQYRDMSERADRISRSINARARQACAQAGLCADLVGIHPHNAMVGYENGQPWPEVDYHYVRLSLYLQTQQFLPQHIVERWNERVWPSVTFN